MFKYHLAADTPDFVFPASSLPGTLAGVFLPSFLSNVSRSDPDCPLQIQPSSERPEAGRLGSRDPSFLRHDLPIEAGKCLDVFVPVVRKPQATSGFLILRHQPPQQPRPALEFSPTAQPWLPANPPVLSILMTTTLLRPRLLLPLPGPHTRPLQFLRPDSPLHHAPHGSWREGASHNARLCYFSFGYLS